VVGHPVSIHLVSTIQSLRTGYFPVRFIWGVCAGISATRFGAFRSLRPSVVSGGDFGALSPHPKNPFLADKALWLTFSNSYPIVGTLDPAPPNALPASGYGRIAVATTRNLLSHKLRES